MFKNKTNYLNKTIFITGTNTDIGKTYSCEKILNNLSKKGLKVGYFKPCETGVKNNTPLDGTKLLNITKKLNPDFNVSINDVVPYQFTLPASPYVAKKNTAIDINFLIEKKEFLLNYCDTLIIEGAGGLMVPINENFFMIDLIKILADKTILVGPSKLGCINDILLSYNALKNKNINFSLYINLFKDKETFEKVSKPFLINYFNKLKYIQDL